MKFDFRQNASQDVFIGLCWYCCWTTQSRQKLQTKLPSSQRILHTWTPIARFESQRNERRAYEDQILSFGWRYELQRTLAVRIAAITLASDSAITIARFRPSKVAMFSGVRQAHFWAHRASKMAALGESLLLCVSQCFRV